MKIASMGAVTGTAPRSKRANGERTCDVLNGKVQPISNNAGSDGAGPGILLPTKQIRKLVSS
jgi:hypothetical protein